MIEWLRDNKQLALQLFGALITGWLLAWLSFSLLSNGASDTEKKPLILGSAYGCEFPTR